MNGFTLVCECGQPMSVPESAIGRTGLCPACGKEIPITRERLHAPSAPRRGGGLLSRKQSALVTQNNEHREEAWRKFATAVDLYNSKRYAEALTLLSGLQQTFPGHPSIETAQAQCMEALQEAASPPRLEYDGEPIAETVLTEELVKSVVLRKMLHGNSEEIQLKAAELGARMLGLLGDAPAPTSAEAPAPVVQFKETSPVAPAANGNNAATTKPPRRKPTVEEIP
jgi:hypothetical protein